MGNTVSGDHAKLPFGYTHAHRGDSNAYYTSSVSRRGLASRLLRNADNSSVGPFPSAATIGGDTALESSGLGSTSGLSVNGGGGVPHYGFMLSTVIEEQQQQQDQQHSWSVHSDHHTPRAAWDSAADDEQDHETPSLSESALGHHSSSGAAPYNNHNNQNSAVSLQPQPHSNVSQAPLTTQQQDEEDPEGRQLHLSTASAPDLATVATTNSDSSVSFPPPSPTSSYLAQAPPLTMSSAVSINWCETSTLGRLDRTNRHCQSGLSAVVAGPSPSSSAGTHNNECGKRAKEAVGATHAIGEDLECILEALAVRQPLEQGPSAATTTPPSSYDFFSSVNANADHQPSSSSASNSSCRSCRSVSSSANATFSPSITKSDQGTILTTLEIQPLLLTDTNAITTTTTTMDDHRPDQKGIERQYCQPYNNHLPRREDEEGGHVQGTAFATSCTTTTATAISAAAPSLYPSALVTASVSSSSLLSSHSSLTSCSSNVVHHHHHYISSTSADEPPVSATKSVYPANSLNATYYTLMESDDDEFDEDEDDWDLDSTLVDPRRRRRRRQVAHDFEDSEDDDEGEDGLEEEEDDEDYYPSDQEEDIKINANRMKQRRAYGSKEVSSSTSSAPCNVICHNGVPLCPFPFADLPSQTKIGLCSAGIVRLSRNIRYLTSTTSVRMCCNQLSRLPQEIGYMSNLTLLDLSKNNLRSLPTSISKLSKLVELRLSFNMIESLPKAIGSLTKLVALSVDNNQLESIPRELGRIQGLITLDLSFNPITVLPADIGKLHLLRRLRLDGCPLVEQFVHSCVYTPPTLLELAARVMVRHDIAIPKRLPRHLKDYLKNSETCTFCEGPYFESMVKRGKMIEKNERLVPLEYNLCVPHWNTEDERVRLLFCQRPATAPPLPKKTSVSPVVTKGPSTRSAPSPAPTASSLRTLSTSSSTPASQSSVTLRGSLSSPPPSRPSTPRSPLSFLGSNKLTNATRRHIKSFSLSRTSSSTLTSSSTSLSSGSESSPSTVATTATTAAAAPSRRHASLRSRVLRRSTTTDVPPATSTFSQASPSSSSSSSSLSSSRATTQYTHMPSPLSSTSSSATLGSIEGASTTVAVGGLLRPSLSRWRRQGTQ